MNKYNKIPARNRSRYGWWVATTIEKFSFDDGGEDSFEIWKNTIIVKASDREEAYEKSISYGKKSDALVEPWVCEKTGRTGRWTFEGLSSLLPIYDEFCENGSEIVFDKAFVSSSELDDLVKAKDELEVFNDKKLKVKYPKGPK